MKISEVLCAVSEHADRDQVKIIEEHIRYNSWPNVNEEQAFYADRIGIAFLDSINEKESLEKQRIRFNPIAYHQMGFMEYSTRLEQEGVYDEDVIKFKAFLCWLMLEGVPDTADAIIEKQSVCHRYHHSNEYASDGYPFHSDFEWAGEGLRICGPRFFN